MPPIVFIAIQLKRVGCGVQPNYSDATHITHKSVFSDLFFSFSQSILICGWLLLVFVAYKAQQFDYEYANFDPYDILGIDIGASNAEIKKAYKKKALVYHPDKETGDEMLFMKLTKGEDLFALIVRV